LTLACVPNPFASSCEAGRDPFCGVRSAAGASGYSVKLEARRPRPALTEGGGGTAGVFPSRFIALAVGGG